MSGSIVRVVALSLVVFQVSRASAATDFNVTIIGKVTELLQEMKARSESLQSQADAEHNELKQICADTISTRQGEISQLEIQRDSLDAEISQGFLDLDQMRTEVSQHEYDITNVSSILEASKSERASAETTFARDLTEYNSAIGAVERALEILAEQSSGAFLAVDIAKRYSAQGSRLATARAAKRRFRSAASYQPDAGGIARDEHIFDEFDSLTTASTNYMTQSNDVEVLLTDLKAAFRSEREKLLDAETANRAEFESEETSLKNQILSSRTALAAVRQSLSSKEVEHTDKEDQYAETSANLNATQAYFDKLQQTCQEKDQSYTDIRAMRLQEIDALDKAIQTLTGELVASAGKYFPALFRLRSSAGVFQPKLSAANQGAAKVLGFLRIQAQKLHSTSIGNLAGALGTLVAESSTGHENEDPIAKVKDMIRDLIQKLEATAIEEAGQKAWCDSELAKNEKAREGAAADIEKHNVSILGHQGNVDKLLMEIAELNTTLEAEGPYRASLVANRSKENQLNLATISDAENSATALENAILILESFYANQTQNFAFAQKRLRLLSLSLTGSSSNQERVNAPSPAELEPLPEVVTRETTAGSPLSAEGKGVIAMLSVLASDFRRLASETTAKETEAAQLQTEVLREHDVMVAAATTDRTYKMQETSRLKDELVDMKIDLNASEEALSDAASAYEDLKPPCLNVETYEERKARRDAEISSLQEANQMLEDFAAQYGGGLLQTAKLNGALSADRAQDLRRSEAVAAAAETNTSLPNATQLQEIASLLGEIRSEVLSDLADDTLVHEEMQRWCGDAILQKQTAIGDAQTRENELLLEIETSAQEKARLEVQIPKMEGDIEHETDSLEQHSDLRAQSEQSFKDAEIELIESIQALKGALTVLSRQYNDSASETRDYEQERTELEDEKTNLNLSNLSLVLAAPGRIMPSGGDSDSTHSLAAFVASAVQHALKTLPDGEVMGGLSAEDASTLRAFLARPQELIFSHDGRNRAALVVQRTRKQGSVDAVDGFTVYGILKQLLETFQADLAAARTKEAQDKSDYESVGTSKAATLEALQASLVTKREQLAHYTIVNAEAKEDYAYNKAAREADTKYLSDVQNQCSESASEFDLRNSSRRKEVDALNDAIDILTAGAGLSSDSSQSASLLHHRAAVGTGRTFLRSRSNLSTAHGRDIIRASSGVGNVSSKPNRATVNAIPNSIVPRRANSSFHVLKAVGATEHRTNNIDTKVPALSLRLSPDQLEKEAQRMHAARRSLSTLSTQAQVKLRVLRRAGGLLASFGKVHQYRVGRSTVGPLTKDALSTVVSRIDSMVSTLVAEKQLEIKMHDTCISEDNQARQQHERRLSDESHLNNTQLRLDAMINKTEDEVDEILAQINSLNTTLMQKELERSQEHEAFRLSVQKHEAHQGKLLEAMQMLTSFYGTAFPQIGNMYAQGHNKVDTLQAVKLEHRSFFARAGPAPAPVLPDRMRNRINQSAYKVQAATSNFSRPLRNHEGTPGILSILQLLLEESEQLVESLVRAETISRDALLLDTNDARTSMENKGNQLVALQETLGETQEERLQVETSLADVRTEMEEITVYLGIVEQKCAFILGQFTESQEARQAELNNLANAKRTLQGMVES